MTHTISLPRSPNVTVNVGPGPDAPPTSLAQNFIFVLIDDASLISPFKDYVTFDPLDDVQDGSQGPTTARFPNTPVMQSLADTGVRFPYCFGAPVCSPTRAGWLTGQYSFHHGVGTVPVFNDAGDLAEFRDPGYDYPTVFDGLPTSVSRGFFGKMHLSIPDTEQFTTGDYIGRAGLGFNVLGRLGFLDHWSVMLRNVLQTDGIDDAAETTPYDRSYYNFGAKTGSAPPSKVEGPYNTTFIFEEAANWIAGRQTGSRFFCYIATGVPHSPISSDLSASPPYTNYPPASLVNTDEYNDLYAAEDGDQYAHYLAGMEAIDNELGNLLNSLDTETRKRTTVVVMSDNGCDEVAYLYGRANDGKTFGANWDYVLDNLQAKGSVHHWGANTWMIWNGPTDGTERVADPGRTSKVLVNVQDMYPTLLKYFGATIPSSDGIEFLDEAWFGGTEHTEHTRRHILSEVFQPLGNWELAPLASTYQILRRYSLILDGTEGPGITPGTYTLLKQSGTTIGILPDELYLTYDTLGNPVDIFERTPLDISGAYAEEYAALDASLTALLDTTTGTGDSIEVTLEDGTSVAYWPRRLNLDGSMYVDSEDGFDDLYRIGVTDAYMPVTLETPPATGRIPFVEAGTTAGWELPFAGDFGVERVPLNASDQLEVEDSNPAVVLTIDSTPGSPNTLDVDDSGTTLTIDLEAV